MRAFARELAGGRPDTEDALRILGSTAETPHADFFRHPGVRWVAANAWLKDDEVALDHVYGALVGAVIAGPRRGRMASRRTKLSCVRKVVDPPIGARQSERVRQVLLEAMLAAGGGLGSRGAPPTLRPFNVISTRYGETLSPHPHQERVIEALQTTYETQGDATVGVVVMPTGAGKTVTAVHWLLDHPVRNGVKVLWVTHRKELLNQTAATFVRWAPLLAGDRGRLSLRLIGAGYGPASTIAGDGHDIVVASIGSLARDMPAVRAFLDAHRCVVVFDEAHHAVARTWREVLQVAREITDDAVIGLTATPTRMADSERRVLADLFVHTIAEVGSAELVGKGYLAEARPSSVQTHVDAESLADDADFEHLRNYHEMSPRLAAALADNVPRNRIIVDKYLQGPEDADDDSFGQTIVFAVNVDHAHVLAKDFARAGCLAGALTAAISTLYRPGDAVGEVVEEATDRDRLLQAFKESKIPVLVNVQVLTEGVDVPTAKSAFLARPTGSEVLMNQMIGRVLRGEEVGGTKHAYLVSFRDHWEQFPDWADPIRLLAPADVERPPVAPKPPQVLLEALNEEEWRRLLDAAAAEVRDRVSATTVDEWCRVPVGVYMFETELPVDDEWAGDDEVEARHVDLYVYEHERAGFERLTKAVGDSSAPADAEAWLESFFDGVPAPRPPLSRLDMLARYVAVEGRMPEYIPLAGRDLVNPRRVAKGLFERDARREERERAVTDAHAANPALVDAFYGGQEGLRRAVLEELYMLEAGVPRSFDEIRVPYVSAPDRLDHVYGQGAHDLAAALHKVRTDPALFPMPLPSPPGGLCWSKRPIGAAWAQYVWDNDPDGADAYVELNILLDARNVEPDIIEFLIYHELLHHQDVVDGRKPHLETGVLQSPHDREFRDRERKHPAITKANAWLDTFLDRLAAIEDNGRLVQ